MQQDTAREREQHAQDGSTRELFARALHCTFRLGLDAAENIARLTASAHELLGGLGAQYAVNRAGVLRVECESSPATAQPWRWTAGTALAARLAEASEVAQPGPLLLCLTPELGSPPTFVAGQPASVWAHLVPSSVAPGALLVWRHTEAAFTVEQGQVLGVIAGALASEERRRNGEAALRQSEEKYRELSELALEAILLIDNETGQLLEVNSASTELYGYTRAELLTMRNVDLSAQPSETRRVTASGSGSVAVPLRFHRRKDGTRFPVEITGRFFSWNGRAVHVAAIRDISERHRVEEALSNRVEALTQPAGDEQAVRFTDLFDLEAIQRIQDAFALATRVASIITRPDGTPLTRPSNFCRLCSGVIRQTPKGLANCYCSDAVIGRQNPEGPIVQPCLSGGLWDAGASITVGGRHIANWLIGQVKNEAQDEQRLLGYADEIGADREAFRAALSEVPVMSREQFERTAYALFLLANELSQKAYQNVLQARFIADRQRAENESARLQDQLQQAMKMEAIGRLAGGVAHDFNNLLTAIRGNVDLLDLEMAPDAPERAYLRDIGHAADSAAGLTRQLLAFSRKQILTPTDIRPNVLVANLFRMLRRLIGENIDLRTQLDPHVGAIHMDPGQFEQVLVNLAVNARDAMEDGGVLTIETRAVRVELPVAAGLQIPPGSYVCLVVSDTGCGMTSDVQRHLFEPFFTTKPKGRGTGLGLATIHGAIKQAGGAIDVQSRPNGGTTFFLYLPSLEPSACGLPTPSGGATSGLEGGTETILLVEDEPMVRELASRILRRLGYDVLAAPDGDVALRLARDSTRRIDLLLTDVILPGIDGRQVAERLGVAHPEARVLFASGYAEDVIAHQGILDAGVQFIAKPYTAEGLAQAVRRVIDGH